jgi:DNA-binding beta-propeller fold protein YncE
MIPCRFIGRFLFRTWIFILPVCFSAMLARTVHGSEFDDLSASFGTTLTLIGVKHTTTTNPDGTAINFWSSAYEGANARFVGLSNPHMAAADAYGNVYIADKASHSILKITKDGLIHTFAGTHEAGFNGDGPDSATDLQINNPNGLFVFPNGTVYLLDPGNHRIRKVDTNGVMTTIVNDPEPDWYPSGRALWVSPDEQLIYYTHEFKPLVVNGVTNLFSDGAAVKQWTATDGIATVCSKDVGFVNPANIAVNPVDGLLYVCDRAEDDSTKNATGLFRIDGPEQRTRITGNISQPGAADGQLALNSFIDQPRGIAFRPDGSYFLCGHKNGSVWFIDTDGVLHNYLRGSGSKDSYTLPDGQHPPLTASTYFAQPRSVTLAPNGSLLVVCNDSGYVFQVNDASTPVMPSDFHVTLLGSDGVSLTWTGIFGRGYRVERAFDLDPASWEPLGAAGGTETNLQFTDPEPATHEHCFYRLLPSL